MSDEPERPGYLPNLVKQIPGIIYDFPSSTHLSNLHKTSYL